MAQPGEAVSAKILKVLRDCCDAPTVLYCSSRSSTLLWRVDLPQQKTKKVILVCTEFFTYLLKRSDYKLITRWVNRSLLINVQQRTVVLSCPLESMYDTSSFISGKGKVSLTGATLEFPSPAEAAKLERSLSQLIQSAERTAELLRMEEAGARSSAAVERPAELSSASDADDMEDAAQDAAGGAHADGTTYSKLDELLRLAPARYIALTSLVDGEFADYTTLKNAYIRKEEDQLLSDLEVFVKENEGRVEALCKMHYSSFINAAQQCLSISARDAEVVGKHLHTANSMVKTSATNIKSCASEVISLQTTCENLDKTREYLNAFIAVVDCLEMAESHVAKQKLCSAILMIRELVRRCAPLAGYVISDYTLHERVPALTRTVSITAAQQLNGWLNQLRIEALTLGRSAMAWRGSVVPGRIAKTVIFADEGGYWWLSEALVPFSSSLTPFEGKVSVDRLHSGTGIQLVFEMLHRGDDFRKCYCEGRKQQIRADFCSAFDCSNLSAEECLLLFDEFCCRALGFILIEDIVHTITSPKVQSFSEILSTWGQLTNAIASRLTAVSRVLLVPSAEPSEEEASTTTAFSPMLRAVDLVRCLVQHSVESVHSVDLNPRHLLSCVESYTDSLMSGWLQDACIAVTASVSLDTLESLVVNSQEEFDDAVTRFHLQRCRFLELPMMPSHFSGTSVSLPFAAFAPKVGAAVLRFLERCHSAIFTDAASALQHSELNNVDEMILKYLSVLFRTVAEAMRQLDTSGKDAVLKCAILVSSCSIMPVIVSCTEQEFLVHWPNDVAMERQKMGSPLLLQASSNLFSLPLQESTQRMLEACITDVKSRLALSSTIIYWYKQLDLRASNEAKRAKEECFAECFRAILLLIDQFSSILPGEMVRSVIGTSVAHMGQSMQHCMDTALKRAHAGSDNNFNAMRACVVEFETQCLTSVPRWQQELRTALPGLTACTRFPLDVPGAVGAARCWIDIKEAQYKEEKANQPQLVAAMEDAGKAFTRGFQAIGKSMTTLARRDKTDS